MLEVDIVAGGGCACELTARILRNLRDRLIASSLRASSEEHRREAAQLAREIDDTARSGAAVLCRCDTPNPEGILYPAFRAP